MTRSSSLATWCCSVQHRDRIFVKGSGFLFFAKNMGTNIGKTIHRNFTGKYSQRRLDHAKKFVTGALKLLQKE